MEQRSSSHKAFGEIINLFCQYYAVTIRLESNMTLADLSYQTWLRSNTFLYSKSDGLLQRHIHYNFRLGFVTEEKLAEYERGKKVIPSCDLFAIADICDPKHSYYDYFNFLIFPQRTRELGMERLIASQARKLNDLGARYFESVSNTKKNFFWEAPYLNELSELLKNSKIIEPSYKAGVRSTENILQEIG